MAFLIDKNKVGSSRIIVDDNIMKCVPLAEEFYNFKIDLLKKYLTKNNASFKMKSISSTCNQIIFEAISSSLILTFLPDDQCNYIKTIIFGTEIENDEFEVYIHQNKFYFEDFEKEGNFLDTEEACHKLFFPKLDKMLGVIKMNDILL